MARVGVYHRTKESVIGGGGKAGVEDFGYVIIVFIWLWLVGIPNPPPPFLSSAINFL